MVAAAKPKFESVLSLNLSRPMLLAAQLAEERGDLIGCGVRLREALRRQLHAMCLYHACLPKSKRAPSPFVLLEALRKEGQCDKHSFCWIKELIDCCNAAAHCGKLNRNALLAGMEFLHRIIDENPCGETFERYPRPESVYDVDDCDDRDAGDWWKGGAA